MEGVLRLLAVRLVPVLRVIARHGGLLSSLPAGISKSPLIETSALSAGSVTDLWGLDPQPNYTLLIAAEHFCFHLLAPSPPFGVSVILFPVW